MAKTILIAIPTNKYIEPETFKSIYDLEIPENCTVDFQFFYGYQIDQIRNLIAEWAKRYDYLFSVDSDIVLPRNALVKLYKANKDIISGLYIQRKADQSTLEIYMKMGNGIVNIPYPALYGYGVTEIVACGFGCCLIKQKVFTTMQYPHFVYKSALDHKDTVSEDVYFCTKARELGFSVWTDPSIRCEHLGSRKFLVPTATPLENTFYTDMLPKEHVDYLYTMNIKPAVIYDIGACVLHWTRKAKETWPNSAFYLFDATSSVVPFQEKANLPFYNGVLCDVDNKPVKFYEKLEHPGGNSYYKETTGAYNESHSINKIGMTLDTVVKNNQWPLPNLIKMDVQGAELDILKGASMCLSQVTDLIVEIQHTNYNDKAPKFNEVQTFLTELGFTFVSCITKTEVDGDYHFTKG